MLKVPEVSEPTPATMAGVALKSLEIFIFVLPNLGVSDALPDVKLNALDKLAPEPKSNPPCVCSEMLCPGILAVESPPSIEALTPGRPAPKPAFQRVLLSPVNGS